MFAEDGEVLRRRDCAWRMMCPPPFFYEGVGWGDGMKRRAILESQYLAAKSDGEWFVQV